MIIVDAEKQILGRMGTFVAKQALLGQKIAIINVEKAIISGTKKFILGEYQRQRDLGVPSQGPYIRRSPEEIVKRSIRGMLPYKKEKGRVALANIKCYRGVPAEFEGKDVTPVPNAEASRITKTKYVTIHEISKELGAKL